jgi:hypothetical protein
MHGSGVQARSELALRPRLLLEARATGIAVGVIAPCQNCGGPRAETGPTTLLETGLLPRLVSMATPCGSGCLTW